MRPLIVSTEAGIATSTAWWANIRIEGSSVILSSSVEDGWPKANLVVAELASVEAARALFDTIKERRTMGARMFDASEWSDHAQRCDPDNSAGGGRS